MSLQQDLEIWNGKSADDIGEVFQRHCKKPEFVDQLLILIGYPETEKGGSWLLKAWLEAGNKLTNRQTTKVYKMFPDLEHWESRLHILQCMPSLPISASNKKRVEYFLRDTLTDTNKFVRAWTYNGWHLLAQQHPEYREEVDQFFELAMKDEAASVKARIRNLLK